jgi:hypothetical protein
VRKFSEEQIIRVLKETEAGRRFKLLGGPQALQLPLRMSSLYSSVSPPRAC